MIAKGALGDFNFYINQQNNSMKIKTIIACIACVATLQLYAKPIESIFVQGGQLMFKGTEVNIKSFEISKYEITNERYAAFLNSKQIESDGKLKGVSLINVDAKDLQVEFLQNKWTAKPGFEDYPMVMVSYYGAVEFCNWMGGRLPDEMEWLYAAQGGVKIMQYSFAGSNSLNEVGWYKNNSDEHAHAVGEKRANELGIHDMSGNAWEWCLNDSLKSDKDFCVHMGGSWYAGEEPARLSAHYGNTPTHFSNSVGFRIIFSNYTVLETNISKYKGKPWNNEPQKIPGKIQCELYDLGGEGIAYHDADSINNGSGKLNPANGTLLNEFRMKEGVDISYTKDNNIDNNPYNLVEPTMGELYAGWTMPGEWINYTIKVNATGTYNIGLMYTASGDSEIAFYVDGKQVTQPLFIPSVRNKKETIDWRNWHHWNRINELTNVQLKKGKHLLTLKTISNGNMNFDYLEFKLKN